MPKPEGKPFEIPKLMVWEAWRQVKENKGAPGVDGQDLDEFEADLKGNLYKICNRMPTVADRVAQTVVAMRLGERAEPRFHPDSYG